MKRTRIKEERKQSRRARPSTGNKATEKQSITKAVRRIVAVQPTLTTKEVAQALIKAGWDSDEVEQRGVTIATPRADASAVLQIAQQAGWSMPVERMRSR